MANSAERFAKNVGKAIDRAQRRDVDPAVLEQILQAYAQDMREEREEEATTD